MGGNVPHLFSHFGGECFGHLLTHRLQGGSEAKKYRLIKRYDLSVVLQLRKYYVEIHNIPN